MVMFNIQNQEFKASLGFFVSKFCLDGSKWLIFRI